MKYQLTLTEEDINTVITALRCELVNALAKEDPYGEKYIRKALDAVRAFTIVKEN